jgi:uncharacterized membrane protein HdeD (DUF308 family)
MVVARIKGDDVTVYDSGSDTATVRAPPLWICALLGLVMSAAGIFALSESRVRHDHQCQADRGYSHRCRRVRDLHAYWTKGWDGFLWQILLGALYLGFGLVFSALLMRCQGFFPMVQVAEKRLVKVAVG